MSLHLLDAAAVSGIVLLLATLLAPDLNLLQYVPFIAAVFLLSLNALSSYRPGAARRDRRRLLGGVTLATLILASLAVFPPHVPFPPLLLATLGIGSFVALAIGRAMADGFMREIYRRGFGVRRVVIIGALDDVSRVLRQLRDGKSFDQHVVGHVSPGGVPDPTAVARLDQLAECLESLDVREVLIATTLESPVLDRVTAHCFAHGVEVFVVPAVSGRALCRAEPIQMGQCLTLALRPPRLRVPALLLKRAFDVSCAAVALVLVLPLMLLISVAIKLDSPGPVFFRHKRVGLGGSVFMMWKFRSMQVDAEIREKELAHLNMYSGGTFKIRDDPRVTPVGRILRRTSLDELPQLFNVLLGNMSLVGPRPALVADIERYESHHFERLAVIPGITGPWQIGGRNLITDFETIVEMERSYIRSWSLLLDIKILFRTLPVIARGEGAY